MRDNENLVAQAAIAGRRQATACRRQSIRMSRLYARLMSIVLLTLGTVTSHLVLAGDDENLAEIHGWIQSRYPTVRHINAELYESLAKQDVLVFDVREQGEFDISHLPGALRIAPRISSEEFLRTYSDVARNKKAVFYCSVGRRSSRLAERVQAGLYQAGVSEVYNLEGGIFGWHNQRQGLVSTAGVTDYIHPYNDKWGHLLERPEMIRYQSLE